SSWRLREVCARLGTEHLVALLVGILVQQAAIAHLRTCTATSITKACAARAACEEQERPGPSQGARAGCADLAPSASARSALPCGSGTEHPAYVGRSGSGLVSSFFASPSIDARLTKTAQGDGRSDRIGMRAPTRMPLHS